MNRRAFLTALGAVATQQKFGTFSSQEIPETLDLPLITITRFPYIQNVHGDRASILWATLEAGVGQVRYSTDGVNYRLATARSRVFSSTETGLPTYVQYTADLTGLAPGTDYVYGVIVNGEDIASAGETRFRTAGPGPFSFLVLGDSGWGARTPSQGQVAQKFSQEKPSLILHTGDLVYGDTTRGGTFAGYQRNYFDYYASTMSYAPFFPCPGNHDYELPDAIPYLSVHSVPTEGVPPADRGRYYSFDWGNVHFVSLDAHQSLERCVNGDGAMLRWLDNDLRSTRQFWRIVFFHYPPFATGVNVNDIQCRWARESIVPILENYGVQVVFNGHEHSYQRNVPIRRNVQVDQGIGTNYFTSGGGGALLYDVPSKPLVAVAKKEFHYLRAEVQGTQITVRSIRQDGAELDNFTITPKPVFTDDPKLVPVTLSPGPTAGAFIRIIGRGLAAEENFVCTSTPPTEMSGTVVTVNGVRIQLLYVSPTQIYAQLPFNVDGNVTIRVTTPNGFIDKSI
jgi:Calcineurin-like phosphoesterase/Purple acid Phosphatase, N-terminal domain/IPT/TIG domain